MARRRILSDVPGAFAAGVARVNELLAPHGARLMPGAAHPWMNPDTETRLWPHDDDTIYRAYDRIFDCRGHGWSNLQSMHVNLPFADDDEFGAPARGDSRRAADPAGARGELAVSRRQRDAGARRAPRDLREEPGADPGDHGRGRSRAGRQRDEYQTRVLAADVPRDRAARPGRHPAPRVAELARRDRTLRPQRDRDPRARHAGAPRRRSRDRAHSWSTAYNGCTKGRQRTLRSANAIPTERLAELFQTLRRRLRKPRRIDEPRYLALFDVARARCCRPVSCGSGSQATDG